jgi:hypothetical protein
MKLRSRWFFLLAVGLGLAGTPAKANVITYVTPTGATAGGEAVNASVTFTTSFNAVMVVLTNLEADPKDVGQNLSDLFFTLNTGQNVGSLTSGTGTVRTVNGGGTFVDGGSAAAGWVLSTSGSGFLLDVLAGTGHAGPAHTLIGPANSGTGKYSNANASIAGNGPHNPFLNQTATFVLSVSGVTADSTVSSATFSFGTTAGNNVTGQSVTGQSIGAPEPSSFFLVGIGLGLTSFFGLRRRWATQRLRETRSSS